VRWVSDTATSGGGQLHPVASDSEAKEMVGEAARLMPREISANSVRTELASISRSSGVAEPAPSLTANVAEFDVIKLFHVPTCSTGHATRIKPAQHALG
jgi:hypothetical protein